MNKHQEALDTLYGLSKGFVKFCHYFDVEKTIQELTKKAMLLQTLVDEKTPTTGSISFGGCYCDNCNYRVGDNNSWTQATVRYCSHCGKRIDWSHDDYPHR